MSFNDWFLWCPLIFSIIYLAATLDIILTWNAWKSLKLSQILRYLLKFVTAFVWAVVLPIGYSSSVRIPAGLVNFFSSSAGDWRNRSFYSYAVVLYLMPNIVSFILFFLPPLRRCMEHSNQWIITLHMWWAQVSMSDLLSYVVLMLLLL